MSNIPEKRNDELIDSGVSDWMAEIYVCLQWKYNISSKTHYTALAFGKN